MNDLIKDVLEKGGNLILTYREDKILYSYFSSSKHDLVIKGCRVEDTDSNNICVCARFSDMSKNMEVAFSNISEMKEKKEKNTVLYIC